MRTFLLAVCAALALHAAEDPKAIVRKAIDSDARSDELARDYTFIKRDDVKMLDGSGAVKTHNIRTFDVTFLDGTPYSRLVAKDDKPLSAVDQKNEENRLRFNEEQRRKESPAQKQQRLADVERKRREFRDHLKEATDAFDFKLVGEDQIAGAPVWVIEGTPHPGYKPKSSFAGYFTKIKGRCWISKDGYRFVKIEVETLDTISIGALLVRLRKGGHILVEQTRVNDEIWLPAHITVKASARILLVKGYNLDADYKFSNYRKFQAESHMVGADGK